MDNWELVARERVRDNYATYTHAGDRFRLDELAGCFAEDGVLEIKGMTTARNRAGIVAMLSGAASPGAPGDAGEKIIVRHQVTNLRFDEITPERIHASAYFSVLTQVGLDHWGRYRDVLVPVGDRWLFAHRFVAVDAMTESSRIK